MLTTSVHTFLLLLHCELWYRTRNRILVVQGHEVISDRSRCHIDLHGSGKPCCKRFRCRNILFCNKLAESASYLWCDFWWSAIWFHFLNGDTISPSSKMSRDSGPSDVQSLSNRTTAKMLVVVVLRFACITLLFAFFEFRKRC